MIGAEDRPNTKQPAHKKSELISPCHHVRLSYLYWDLLSTDTKANVDLHIKHCAECQQKIQEMPAAAICGDQFGMPFLSRGGLKALLSPSSDMFDHLVVAKHIETCQECTKLFVEFIEIGSWRATLSIKFPGWEKIKMRKIDK